MTLRYTHLFIHLLLSDLFVVVEFVGFHRKYNYHILSVHTSLARKLKTSRLFSLEGTTRLMFIQGFHKKLLVYQLQTFLKQNSKLCKGHCLVLNRCTSINLHFCVTFSCADLQRKQRNCFALSVKVTKRMLDVIRMLYSVNINICIHICYVKWYP